MSDTQSPPRLDLDKLDALHVDFVQMFERHQGRQLDSQLCRRIAYNVHVAMNARGVSDDAIFQTLMQYEGRELDAHWSNLLSRQLVARKDELRLGALQLFEKPVRDEWVPAEIVLTTDCVWRDSERGQILSLYCLGGHPAGHTLAKKVPERWLSWLAYQIGYSRRRVYDHDPSELVGMRFWGYLLGNRDSAQLDFDAWCIDNRMKRHNQSILKLRRRHDIEPHEIPDGKEEEYSCPFNYDHYCSECGRTVRDCIAAPDRERTYARRPVVDRPAAEDRQPGGGRESPTDPVA